jgi:hypothetical protein
LQRESGLVEPEIGESKHLRRGHLYFESVPISKKPTWWQLRMQGWGIARTWPSLLSGLGVVVATGDNAEISKINKLVSKVERYNGQQTYACIYGQ